ncbi:hypothetical protein M0802_016106, partial [Mischocyttarus mexicanus]
DNLKSPYKPAKEDISETSKQNDQTNKKSTDKKTVPVSQKTGFDNLFAKVPNKENNVIPSTSKDIKNNKEITPERKYTDKTKSSSKENKSVKREEKRSISSFFGKNSNVTQNSSKDNETKKEHVKKEEINKEQAKENHIVKDSIENKAKTEVIKSNNITEKKTRGIKRNRTKESQNVIKKRKRIIVDDDSSDSQNEDVNMESEPDSEIEEESILDNVEKSPSPPRMTNKNGKARILKTVDQTYEEDGFLVTKKVHVFENCSEDVVEAKKKEEPKSTESIINCHEKLLTSNKIIQMNSLTLDQYQNVQELILSKNNLTLISSAVFIKLKHMKKLDLSENLMSEMYIDALAESNNLDELNYSNNKLKIFDNIIFDKVLKITKLNLSHNYIEILKSTIMSKPNTGLITLDLSYNNITFIDEAFLKPLLHLQYLNLSFNKITSIYENAFLQLSDLKILMLNNNFLSLLNFNELPKNLTELHIGYNKIIKLLFESSQIHVPNINLTNISQLEYLNISGNSLSDFPNITLRRLKVLDISNNNFSYIPTYLSSENYSLLSTLIVSGNPIKNLTLYSKLRLQSFVANNITFVEKINYDTLLKLEGPKDNCINLTISNNKNLIFIDERALDHMNACFVDLSNNKINYISPKLVLSSNGSLKINNGINLQGNPFACNCSLQWMLSDLIPQLYVINPSTLNNLRCATPLSLSNKRIVHWYKWKNKIFCDDVSELSDFSEKDNTVHLEEVHEKEVIKIESSPGLLAILGSAMLLLIVLFVIGILLTQKLEKRRSRKNRRF